MPNINIRNTNPIAGIRTDNPSVRVSSFQTGRAADPSHVTIPAGTPMGLLLVLTYANALFSGVDNLGPRPTVTIRNV